MLSLLIAAWLTPPVAGIALAPHYEGTRAPEQMRGMVDEIADFGGTHLVLVVQWGQEDVAGDRIAPYEWGTDDHEVRALARHARARGLAVVIFPILRLARLSPGRWRGTLEPRDRARWWADYRAFIVHYARLADEVGAEIFSVGSELGSMEDDLREWRALIAAVRARFRGQLIYSANWDRYIHVRFWRELDLLGVNGYHPITRADDASAESLAAAWRRLRDRLVLWRYVMGMPLVITELGYPSVDGGARRPYAFEAQGPVDLEEQRRAFAAFRDAWRETRLHGVFIWLWTGRGGPEDAGYMLRGKPAGALVSDWFRER